MIVFITAHDEATQDNMSVAGYIATPPNALCGPDAIRDRAIEVLNGAPAIPFLAFSHGDPNSLQGNDNEPAVTIDDCGLLIGRESFAFACHTATNIGPCVAAGGGTWFGFAGPINCLPADQATVHHFVEIVEFIRSRFPGCSTTASAQSFIADLDALTGEAFEEIERTDEGTMEVFHSLRDITRRLRIWLPGHCESVKHEEARDGPLI